MFPHFLKLFICKLFVARASLVPVSTHHFTDYNQLLLFFTLFFFRLIFSIFFFFFTILSHFIQSPFPHLIMSVSLSVPVFLPLSLSSLSPFSHRLLVAIRFGVNTSHSKMQHHISFLQSGNLKENEAQGAFVDPTKGINSSQQTSQIQGTQLQRPAD